MWVKFLAKQTKSNLKWKGKIFQPLRICDEGAFFHLKSWFCIISCPEIPVRSCMSFHYNSHFKNKYICSQEAAWNFKDIVLFQKEFYLVTRVYINTFISIRYDIGTRSRSRFNRSRYTIHLAPENMFSILLIQYGF